MRSMKLMIHMMRAMVYIGIIMFMGMMAAFEIVWDLEMVLLDLDSEKTFVLKMIITIIIAVIGSTACIYGTREMTKIEE